MIPIQNELANQNSETHESNTKKGCQQNQRLEHEFLADEVNIFG